MQSAPVSPPPITITSSSLAESVVAVGQAGVEQALGVASEEVHREVDALQVAARAAAGRIERLGGAGGQQHRVEFVR